MGGAAASAEGCESDEEDWPAGGTPAMKASFVEPMLLLKTEKLPAIAGVVGGMAWPKLLWVFEHIREEPFADLLLSPGE